MIDDKMIVKYKILLTIPNFNTAGSGKVLYDLAKGLNPELFEVSILCKNNEGIFFKEIEALNLPIFFMDPTVPLRPYYNLLSRISVFKNFVKKNNFDIVHSWHWSSDWTEVVGARWGGAKFVFTKKAMTWGNIHWKIRSFLSNFIITVNDDMRNYFPYKRNQKLIPFGIDTDYFNLKLFLKNRKKSSFKIITVANLVPVKDIEVLIDAVHLINNQDICLDILGDNNTEYGAYLLNKVKQLKLEKQVIFLGKQNDVRTFLSQADLYVISSKKEGMPMALVEAMSMGIPVLGSDVSGINFVLKDFQKFLFKTSNAKMLAEKINLFYHKPKKEIESIGLKLKAYALINFSIEKFIIEHQELYKELLIK